MGRYPLIAVTAALSVLSCLTVAPAQEVGFVESFALAQDRAKVLEQLVPGTEEYYYYRCLERQHAGRLDEVPPLLATWIERHGRGQRVTEIENRQALLSYAKDPAATFRFLKDRMKLRFDHQRSVKGQKPDLPTRLDPSAISIKTLSERALKRYPRSLDGFTTSGLDSLAASSLDPKLLVALLGRLYRPDVPNLPALVVRELEARNSRGFGALSIHKKLLLSQLEECARLRPSLLANDTFVRNWLTRLAPNPDAAPLEDRAARKQYLERLQRFSDRLPSVHNSLKAHILHHRLVFDLEAEHLDKDRFLSYLRLPRRTRYVNPAHVRQRRNDELVDASRQYPTGFDPIANDEPIVRAYLSHFLADADTTAPYAEFIERDYLKRVFAETKILAGDPDTERWYSVLNDPAYYDQLRDRVEISFPASQPRNFGADDPVTMKVDIKNVETLLVKVYEVNTVNYYADTGREVDATIRVEGVVPSEETTHTYSESPFRRVRRAFSLDSLNRPGVYVVDFIGNGLASRAVIVKGRLRYQQRLGSAGHVFRVLNERGEHLKDAAIVMGGRAYPADDAGEILIPYSTQPGNKKIILQQGGIATLESFRHEREDYALRAGIYVDRESLLSGNTATVLIRPTLELNGRSVSLELLEEPRLSLTYENQEGVKSVVVIEDLKLNPDRESLHEIEVPRSLARLSAQLRGRVKNLSRGKTVDVSSRSASFAVNQIDKTQLTSCPLLVRSAEGYSVEIRGKNGEVAPERPIEVTLHHRDFRDALTVKLKTDDKGRVQLGALDGITRIAVSGLPSRNRSWQLTVADRTYESQLHAAEGATIRVPYQGEAEKISRKIISLIEVRGGAMVRDWIERAALVNGFIEITGLAAGDYELRLKEIDLGLNIKVAAGAVRNGWVNGASRMLQVTDLDPLHVTSVRREGDEFLIQCSNTNAATRLHVFGTRYVPSSALDRLHAYAAPVAGEVPHLHVPSIYASGRKIDDEYRYILDRRYAKKYPGNMLKRPGLLLNPWARQDANDAIGLGGGAGGAFGGRRGGRRSLRAAGGGGKSEEMSPPGAFPNLDFLPAPSRLVTNLRPDASGVVRVPVEALGDGHLIHVVAMDQQDTVYASITAPESALTPTDRRLDRSLDVSKSFAETRSIDFAPAGQPIVIDTQVSEVKTYGSLADVFDLYRTLGGGGLNTFSFVLGWPGLTDERKKALYSEHACHELNFFIHQKDPTFFNEVVRPYISNKAHKTFLDHWLLERDLTGYLEPRAFSRLNVVERVLLTTRLQGPGGAGSRHVRELLELRPPEQAGEGLAFKSALFSRNSKPQSGRWDRRSRGRPMGGGGDIPPPTSAAPSPWPSRRSKSKRELEDSRAADKHVEMDEEVAEAQAFDQAPREEMNRAADGKKGSAIDRDAAMEQRQQGLMDLGRRKNVRGLYRAPNPTQSFVEHNYWHRTAEQSGPDMIRVSQFWIDYADRPADQPFFSTRFPEASGCVAEMMFALSVLDLPFEAGDQDVARTDDTITLTSTTPLLLVRKQINEAAPADSDTETLVSEAFFRMDDRYQFDGREKREKYITDEFITGVAYGCKVIITNPTATAQSLDVLLQIPQGSIPVQRGFETKGMEVRVGPHSTENLEYGFYFPTEGSYPHYPVHAAQDGKLIAAARPSTLKVVATPSSVDATSWDHVSQRGTLDEVVAYLNGANLQRTVLVRIAWRMRDRTAFTRITDLLRDRYTFDQTLWSYGLLHEDPGTTEEYLSHVDRFLDQCGRWLDTPLVKVDPIERLAWQQVEYYPLFNERAHRFGARHQIANVQLARQYDSLLHILSARPRLDDEDWMTVTCYLLLQDRVEEALASFGQVDADKLETRLQHDYMRAYMDFFGDDQTAARALAEQHQDHPVERWRQRFRDVLQQLDEAEGKAVAAQDTTDRERMQAEQAAKAPALELAVESRKVNVNYKNLTSCEVSFYEMDIEFLFSSSPFVQKGSGAFAHVKPNQKIRVELPENADTVNLDLPEAYANSNILVEVRAGGIVKRQAYYANSLSVQVIESWGQLKVAHATSGKPMPKTYVKVFARDQRGKVRFHKDGYTDLRGRFDFASLSGPNRTGARQYAILVLSESDGAVIREVDAPVQ